MDLFDAIYKRRSIREYLPDPVSRRDLEQIVAAGVEAPSGCNMQLRQYVIVDDPAVMEKLRPFSSALKTAPAAVILLVSPTPTKFGEFWMQDISAAMENMLLAATALGYGSCWVEGALRRCEEQLRTLLQVPKDLRIWSLMSVGKSAAKPPRPAKPSPNEVTYYNRFGLK